MDSLIPAAVPLAAMRTESGNVSGGRMPNDDQHFLLYFIMGTYFGPDLKGEMPRKAVLQRTAEGLPPYTSDQLAGSHMKTVEVEQVYHYVLRKADQSLIGKLPCLHQFLQGNLQTSGHDSASFFVYPQFSDLFPLELHPHSTFNNQYDIIENIEFINNPEILYIKQDDVERFMRLTGLEDFHLDRDAAMLHTSLNGGVLYDVPLKEAETNGELPSFWSSNRSQRTRCVDEIPKYEYQRIRVLPISYETPVPTQDDKTPMEKVDPAVIFVPSHLTKQEWFNIVTATKNGFALTGSAAMGQMGPIIGLMDIGECEDSYLFRVSLPGVKRDERDFSCEVENSGQVSIRGVTTTGEKTVHRYSQVFEMQTQNLCPSGHFSITFQLPGPVDPQQFSGNFGIDGMLEGIVMKRKDASG